MENDGLRKEIEAYKRDMLRAQELER